MAFFKCMAPSVALRIGNAQPKQSTQAGDADCTYSGGYHSLGAPGLSLKLSNPREPTALRVLGNNPHLRAGLRRLLLIPAHMKLTAYALTLLAKLFTGATVRWVDCQPDVCQRVYF